MGEIFKDKTLQIKQTRKFKGTVTKWPVQKQIQLAQETCRTNMNFLYLSTTRQYFTVQKKNELICIRGNECVKFVLRFILISFKSSNNLVSKLSCSSLTNQLLRNSEYIKRLEMHNIILTCYWFDMVIYVRNNVLRRQERTINYALQQMLCNSPYLLNER